MIRHLSRFVASLIVFGAVLACTDSLRAEVIAYDDYLQFGSEAKVREAGKLSVEGKDYIVQDGDVVHFRFNV